MVRVVVNGDLTKMTQYRGFLNHGASIPAHTYEFKLAARDGSVRDVEILRQPIAGTKRTAIHFVDISDLMRSAEGHLERGKIPFADRLPG